MAIVYRDKRAKKNPWVVYIRIYGEPGSKPKQRYFHFPTEADANQIAKELRKQQREQRKLKARQALSEFIAQGPMTKTVMMTDDAKDDSKAPPTTTGLELSEAIRRYRKLVVKSVKTMKQEQFFFTDFYKWCFDRNIFYLSQVTRENLSEFQASLYHEKKNHESSVNRKMAPIRAMFVEMVRSKELTESPAQYLARFKAPLEDVQNNTDQTKETEHKRWTPEILNSFLELSPDWQKIVLRTLWETGRAPVELHRMKVGHVDFTTNTINRIERFKGRGAKVAPLFITDDFAQVLKEHIDKLAESGRGAAKDPLFPNDKGIPFLPDTLTRNVSRINKLLGVEGYTAYDLRHGLATYLVEQDVPIKKVSVFLGHKKVATTERYVHMTGVNLTAAMNKRSGKKESAG